MSPILGRQLRLKERIRDLLARSRIRLAHIARRLRIVKYKMKSARYRLETLARTARYGAEDAGHEVGKMSRHMEALLFSVIIVLGVIMLFSAGSANFIESLIALLLLVLVVVIYMQLKFQRSMLQQYVPSIDFVKVLRCQLYSDRIRVLNIHGAREKMYSIGVVRNVKIMYDIVNDSFSPVSMHSASLAIMMRDGRKISLPSAMSIINVEPKRSAGTGVSFRLEKGVEFDSIKWLELRLSGNCKKRVRIEPQLYVNLMLRGKEPRFIFEPFSRFIRRKEIAGSGKGRSAGGPAAKKA